MTRNFEIFHSSSQPDLDLPRGFYYWYKDPDSGPESDPIGIYDDEDDAREAALDELAIETAGDLTLAEAREIGGEVFEAACRRDGHVEV